jgi:hypothetical protein
MERLAANLDSYNTMKIFIGLLFTCAFACCAALIQSGWTTTSDAALARAALGITAGSQTPWTSDIDAAGHNLIDVSSVQISGGSVLNADEFDSSSGNSAFILQVSSSFGILNGEPAGVGADINLVSDNGSVIISPRLGIGTNSPSSAIDIASTSPSESPFIHLTYDQGGIGDVSCGIQFFNENGINGNFSATANGFTPSGAIAANQLVFLSRQSGGLLFSTYGGGPMYLLERPQRKLQGLNPEQDSF